MNAQNYESSGDKDTNSRASAANSSEKPIHREKNLFQNKKRKNVPIRGSHMPIIQNKIEVINENQE